MIDAGRNLLVVVVTVVLVVAASGIAQGGFEALFPISSERTFGLTDVSTYFVTVMLGLLFLVAGYTVPRWLKSASPSLWLLAPIAALWVFAIVQYPGALGCVPGVTTGCWVAHMPFAAAVCAVAAGTALRRYRNAA